jgi:AraC-like DNA-binding protein
MPNGILGCAEVNFPRRGFDDQVLAGAGSWVERPAAAARCRQRRGDKSLEADVLGVSTRTLHQAFHSYAGINAHRYLLARKLHLARRHLARTPGFRPTVTEAACSARRRAKPWRTTARLSAAAD